ncbi:MAG: IS110 family transposase [Candidatus Limnocylindria bacterium]
MLYAGLDLSRKRLDVCVLAEDGAEVLVTAVAPDADALRTLTARVARSSRQPVTAAIESMTGARFVHDTLERWGWEVHIADAQRAKALAPLAAKTDRIDARVLAELARRDLVPAIWLPDPAVRAERERARFRLHLVHHRTALKNRIHATLMSFGHPVPTSDLFGVAGRQLLERLALPEPWATSVTTSLALIDELERQIATAEAELRRLGGDHPDVELLRTVPGIGWVLATTIAAEIGDAARFRSPKQLAGYTGLCPFVIQSGDRDRRGPLTKHGPRYLRWALIEAATHAARHPAYRERYLRTRRRLGRQRGPRVARVEVARQLATAIWHMLTKRQPFAPAGPAAYLVASTTLS